MGYESFQIELPGEDDKFFELFEEHQKRLYAFIRSMVFSAHDADEVMQETSIVIWKKMDEFQVGTNFMAWSFRIARFQVMNFQKKAVNLKKRVGFSEDLIEELADTREKMEPELGYKWDVLEVCRKKLKEKDQRLLEQVYGLGMEVDELAKHLGRKATSIYRSLRRIRMTLEKCVEKQSAGGAL
jgi:RNA polymerase sigma-70 factor (ECF subfamily)